MIILGKVALWQRCLVKSSHFVITNMVCNRLIVVLEYRRRGGLRELVVVQIYHTLVLIVLRHHVFG